MVVALSWQQIACPTICYPAARLSLNSKYRLFYNHAWNNSMASSDDKTQTCPPDLQSLLDLFPAPSSISSHSSLQIEPLYLLVCIPVLQHAKQFLTSDFLYSCIYSPFCPERLSPWFSHSFYLNTLKSPFRALPSAPSFSVHLLPSAFIFSVCLVSVCYTHWHASSVKASTMLSGG